MTGVSMEPRAVRASAPSRADRGADRGKLNETHPFEAAGRTFGDADAFFRFDCQTANASPPACIGARAAPYCFSRLASWRRSGNDMRVRGAERREAHKSTRAKRGRVLRKRARLAALHVRLWHRPSAMPRLRSALACPRDEPGRQRAPRAGAVVPPGRVPKPPGCVAANHARGRRASRSRIAPHCRRRSWARISTPASGLLRHQDASRWRPSASRVIGI